MNSTVLKLIVKRFAVGLGYRIWIIDASIHSSFGTHNVSCQLV
jgi:D-alanine-D-alanine ligase-like ATP-grasp enzyme